MRIRRGGTLAAAVVVGLVIGATVVRRHNHPGIPLLPGPARRQALAEAQLRVDLPQVRFRSTPLEKALQEMQAASGATFVVDWDAIEFSNLNRRDDPVDLSLSNVTVEQALKALLVYLNGGRHGSLEYTLFNGTVVITTNEHVGRYVYAAVYDLRDFETGPPPAYDPMAQQVQQTAPAGQGNYCFGAPAAPQGPPTRAETDESLTSLIQGTVASDSWLDEGGDVGTVHTLGGRVIAVTTWQNHRQIAALVSQLRNPSR